jgi:hypothetical protein
MNEPLLHLLWHPIYQTFQLIIASKLSTLIRSTKNERNTNDVQTEAKKMIDLDRDRNSLTKLN